MLDTKTHDLEKNEVPYEIKDTYTYIDCIYERLCHIVPLIIFFTVFVIILLCILRGTIVQWSGD